MCCSSLTLPAETGLAAAAVSLQYTTIVQCGNASGPSAALLQGKLCYWQPASWSWPQVMYSMWSGFRVPMNGSTMPALCVGSTNLHVFHRHTVPFNTDPSGQHWVQMRHLSQHWSKWLVTQAMAHLRNTSLWVYICGGETRKHWWSLWYGR